VAKTFLCSKGFYLENKMQFRGREIPEEDGRRFNQIRVAWAHSKRTERI